MLALTSEYCRLKFVNTCIVELYTVDATFNGTVTIFSGNTWTVLKKEKHVINNA